MFHRSYAFVGLRRGETVAYWARHHLSVYCPTLRSDEPCRYRRLQAQGLEQTVVSNSDASILRDRHWRTLTATPYRVLRATLCIAVRLVARCIKLIFVRHWSFDKPQNAVTMSARQQASDSASTSLLPAISDFWQSKSLFVSRVICVRSMCMNSTLSRVPSDGHRATIDTSQDAWYQSSCSI